MRVKVSGTLGIAAMFQCRTTRPHDARSHAHTRRDTALMHATWIFDGKTHESRRLSVVPWGVRKLPEISSLTGFLLSRLTSALKPDSVMRLLSSARRQADPFEAHQVAILLRARYATKGGASLITLPGNFNSHCLSSLEYDLLNTTHSPHCVCSTRVRSMERTGGIVVVVQCRNTCCCCNEAAVVPTKRSLRLDPSNTRSRDPCTSRGLTPSGLFSSHAASQGYCQSHGTWLILSKYRS